MTFKNKIANEIELSATAVDVENRKRVFELLSTTEFDRVYLSKNNHRWFLRFEKYENDELNCYIRASHASKSLIEIREFGDESPCVMFVTEADDEYRTKLSAILRRKIYDLISYEKAYPEFISSEDSLKERLDKILKESEEDRFSKAVATVLQWAVEGVIPDIITFDFSKLSFNAEVARYQGDEVKEGVQLIYGTPGRAIASNKLTFSTISRDSTRFDVNLNKHICMMLSESFTRLFEKLL
jgi:hypothetical protein